VTAPPGRSAAPHGLDGRFWLRERPGACRTPGDAHRRGEDRPLRLAEGESRAAERVAACHDLSARWDHWAWVDLPVEETRERLGIPPLAG